MTTGGSLGVPCGMRPAPKFATVAPATGLRPGRETSNAAAACESGCGLSALHWSALDAFCRAHRARSVVKVTTRRHTPIAVAARSARGRQQQGPPAHDVGAPCALSSERRRKWVGEKPLGVEHEVADVARDAAPAGALQAVIEADTFMADATRQASLRDRRHAVRHGARIARCHPCRRRELQLLRVPLHAKRLRGGSNRQAPPHSWAPRSLCARPVVTRSVVSSVERITSSRQAAARSRPHFDAHQPWSRRPGIDSSPWRQPANRMQRTLGDGANPARR